MFLKQILMWVNNPQKTTINMTNGVDGVPQYREPQTLYERIAQGNALEEAESNARGQWHR